LAEFALETGAKNENLKYLAVVRAGSLNEDVQSKFFDDFSKPKTLGAMLLFEHLATGSG
jgi:hypothetical protein